MSDTWVTKQRDYSKLFLLSSFELLDWVCLGYTRLACRVQPQTLDCAVRSTPRSKLLPMLICLKRSIDARQVAAVPRSFCKGKPDRRMDNSIPTPSLEENRTLVVFTSRADAQEKRKSHRMTSPEGRKPRAQLQDPFHHGQCNRPNAPYITTQHPPHPFSFS